MTLTKHFHFLLMMGFLSFHPFPGKGNVSNKNDLIADARVRELFYEGTLHLYHFEFQDASKDAQLLIRSHPSSPWGHVLMANHNWWKIISGENNHKMQKAFQTELDQAEKRIRKPYTDENLYCLIVIQSLRSRFELMNKNYVAAMLVLKKSRDLILYAEGKEETYEPFLLTRGLFQYFISAARERMGILSMLIPMETSKAKGIECLERLSKSADPVLSAEGNYFLMKIFLEMEQEPQRARPYSSHLVRTYPGNLIFCYYNQKINDLTAKEANAPVMEKGCSLREDARLQLSEDQIKYMGVLLNQKK